MQLTLLVPELIWPEPEDRATLESLACPALCTLLARSRQTRRPPQSLEATLTDAFGLPDGAPYAAFRLLGEMSGPSDSPADACWVCADPVHLRFHQERLILADSGSFGIELAEAQTLADELNRHFPDVGRFHVAAAERWYLQLSATANLGDFDVPPLSAIAGRRIDRQLPETQQTAWLRRLLNEAQMVLHEHPANAARQSDGRLPINSLWLWGAGALPLRTESAFDGVWSTYPLALGLARAAGVPTHAVPPDAAAFQSLAAPETHHLVVLDDLQRPVQYQNGEDYRHALLALEAHWFAPLRQALASGKISRLRLEASTAYAALAWESRRAEQWKLWRRPQSLSAIAQNLAKGDA